MRVEFQLHVIRCTAFAGIALSRQACVLPARRRSSAPLEVAHPPGASPSYHADRFVLLFRVVVSSCCCCGSTTRYNVNRWAILKRILAVTIFLLLRAVFFVLLFFL